MKLLQILFVYILSTGFCIGLDFVWIGGIMKHFYANQLQHLARLSHGSISPNLPAAIFVWILITLGIALFVISPEPKIPTLADALWGAIFGFIVYGVYDLTNLATLKDWPLLLTAIDMVWGTALCSATAFVMRFLYALIL